MLTENRKQTGLMEGQSVTFNMSAASIDAVCGVLFVKRRKETVVTGDLGRSLDVRPAILPCPSNPSAAETSKRCCWRAGWRPTLGS